MTAHELLVELGKLNVRGDALVAHDCGGDFIASERIATHEYEKDGRNVRGIVLWNGESADARLKCFDGLLTVAKLTTSLRNVPPKTEVMCSATGFIDETPRIVSSVKVYEKVCKGQVRKQVVKLQVYDSDEPMPKLVFKQWYKVVYNQKTSAGYVQELIGYGRTLKEAEVLIQWNHRHLDGGNPERPVERSPRDYDVVECWRAVT